jgi:hypothetical protein
MRPAWTIPIAILALLALAGCAVVGSAPVIDITAVDARTPAAGRTACKSTLGSYALPRQMLNLKVYETATVFQFAIAPGTTVADNNHVFCLDHLVNSFADDTVRVFKQTVTDNDTINPVVGTLASPFLQLIASSAIDRSPDIIRKIIRTAFIILSGNKDFSSARASVGDATNKIIRDFTFDPFNAADLAEINQSVSKLGICVVNGVYSFDTGPVSPARYCDAPQKVLNSHPSPRMQALERQRYVHGKPQSGIFYRPLADYRLSVFVKADPGSREPWRLAQMFSFASGNISPIVSVGVGRAAFATRRTGLIFVDGVLTDVCIAKGSEAAGFINIPLDIIYGIIALPNETVRGQINSATTRKQLLLAQDKLMEVQNAYIDYLTGKAPDKSKITPESGISDGGEKLELGSSIPAPETTPLPDRGLNGDSVALLTADQPLADICKELNAANTDSAIGKREKNESGGF